MAAPVAAAAAMNPATMAAMMQGAGAMGQAATSMVSKPIELYAMFRAMKEREKAQRQAERRQTRQDEIREDQLMQRREDRNIGAVDKMGQAGQNYQQNLLDMYRNFQRGAV